MAHVVCLLNVETDRATFTWSEGPASFEPYVLDRMVFKDFQEVAAEARKQLADLVKDYLFDPPNVPQAAFALATAGHELYQAIFQPGAEQARQAKQVRKWLEQLAEQQEVDTLEVVVESPWSLPWNILYDRPPDKAAFLAADNGAEQWLPFWGLRYNLAGGRKVDPLRRMPVLLKPHVLLVVDPEIRDGLPDEQQKRLADFVASRQLKIVHNKDDLQAAITAQRPDLLYWLSHASADALVLAGEPISPRNLRKLLRQDDDENFGGLAFLNACQTAEGGASGSFFEAFHSVGFAGMIGTEHQTVDQFANPLGLDFLEAFLDRGEPVGQVLRKLRGQVPLGLLYGTYCPPDIRVGRAKDQHAFEIRQVHVQGVALSAGPAAHAAAIQLLPPLPSEPYRSLAYYDRADRALFAGREDDIERFARMLDDSATRIVVLHGESGVGKSSFLHAGVIPYLEEECLGYRFLRERSSPASPGRHNSVMFIRATNDLFGQLAQTLCDFCADPFEYETPLGEQVSADLPGALQDQVGDVVNPGTLRALLQADPAWLGQILSAIGDCLPFTTILVIDQGEEVFTLAQTPEDQQRGRQALDMLRRTVSTSSDFKIILALRTEYYGRVIDRLRRGHHDSGRIREYLLTDFDEDNLTEAIRRPTATERIPYTSEVPNEKFGFRYDAGVAAEIARRVVRYTSERRDSVLPLMQVICTQLYRRAISRADRTISLTDLDALGGIEGGMRNHVDALLRELLRARPLDKRHVQKLFTLLYLQQPDGTLTTALLAEDEVRKRWTGLMPFDELLRQSREMRLLKVNTLRIGMEEERRYVSLGHDALAKIAAAWDEELSRGARIRKMALAIGVVSTVAAVMTILALFALVQRRQALANKDDANRRFKETRQTVDKWFTGVGVGLKDLPYTDHIRTRLLQDAAKDYAQFAAEKGNDLDLQIESARARLRLGELYLELGDLNETEAAYRTAVQDFRDLLRIAPHNVDCQRELANSQARLAVMLAAAERNQEALAEFEVALASLSRLAEAHPAAKDVRETRGSVLLDMALLLKETGDRAAAHGLLVEAQDDFERLARDKEPRYRQQLANVMQARAAVLNELVRNEESVALLRAAIQVWQGLAANDPQQRAYREGLAGSQMDLASNLFVFGRDAESEQGYQAALKEYKFLLDTFGPVRHYRVNVAKSQANLGILLHNTGRNRDASEILLGSAREFELLLLQQYPSTIMEREAAVLSVATLAEVFGELGDDDFAQQGLREAIEKWNALVADAPDRPILRERRGASRINLGRVLHKLGEVEQAKAAYDTASADLSDDNPYCRDLLAFRHSFLGDLYIEMGEEELARTAYREAIAVREFLIGPTRVNNLAWLLTHCQDETLRDPRRAIELTRHLVTEVPENGQYWGTYGAAYYRAATSHSSPPPSSADELDKSIEFLLKATQLRPHPDCADWFCLAMAYWQRGAKEEANQKFQQALEIMQQTRPGNFERKKLLYEAAELLGLPNDRK